MQSQQMTVPFDRLIRDDATNVRKKYKADAIEEMKASILAHGIIQPIAARPPEASDADLGGQLYRIFAGGRRWVAMGELVKEGKIAADYDVPIIIREVDDTEAAELSLAENLVREQMTPVDEFRAFAKLADGGQSTADIALHFGQTERYVKGRLALAKLHPDILAAFEEGKLSFAAACAYTLNPDPEVQAKHYRDNGRNYWGREAHTIKSAMRSTGIRADDKVAVFIGEEAYLAAGGVVSEDLFGEDVMWTSGDLIDRLKAEALERFRAEHLADGWSFCETTEELGVSGIYRLQQMSPEGSDLTEEEVNRMEEIAEELEGAMEDDEEADKLREEYDALDARSSFFTAEQKAKGGYVIDMETMQVRAGCLRPAAAQDAKGEDGAEPLATAAKAAKDPLALTQPLKDKVGETASEALAAAVLADPYRALALATAMLSSADDRTMGIGRPSRIKVERVDYAYSREEKSTDIKKLFDTFAKFHPDELLKRFAGFMAQTIDLTERWFYKDGYTSDDRKEKTRSEFLTAFGADPLEQFDPEDWFSACSKPMIDAAMREMTGYAVTKPKKADMAREAAEKARETGWLPKPLRLAGYALKGKKPASEKKSAAKKATGRSKAKAAA